METIQHQVKLSRDYEATPEKVFAALTDPEALARWFAPHPELRTVVDKIEPHVGGSFAISMVHDQGSIHTMQGTIRELEQGRRLVMTWKWTSGEMSAIGETLVTFDLEEISPGCTRLTLTHDGFAAEAVADGHAEGWRGCLWQLEKVASSAALTHGLALQLALHRRLYDNVLEAVSAEQLAERFTRTTNHILWIAGHIAHTRTMIARLLGSGLAPSLSIFDEAIRDDVDYPGLSQCQEHFKAASLDIMRRLPLVTTEELSAPSPMTLPVNDQTTGGVLTFLTDHEAYHLGQLGILRKVAGHPAMSYEPAAEAPVTAEPQV